MKNSKNGRSIGYARVSTPEQSANLQIDALNIFGCKKIFVDIGVSGGTHPHERKVFRDALKAAGGQGILAVWKMDRLGRSLKNIITTVDLLRDSGIQFVSLTENIDTTTATGRAFWQFIALMAELERGLIRERTREGLAAAKARGVKLGRPRKLSIQKIKTAKHLILKGGACRVKVAQEMGVSCSTLRRYLLMDDVV